MQGFMRPNNTAFAMAFQGGACSMISTGPKASPPTQEPESSASGPLELPPCPEKTSAWLGKVFSTWLSPLVTRGMEKPLEPSDLYALDSTFSSEFVGSRLEKTWNERSASPDGSKWPLLWAISDAFGWKIYWSGLLKFIGDSSTMASPLVMRLLINNMENSRLAYTYCAIIFILQVIANISVNLYFTVNFRGGMRARTALNAAIFRKAQRLSASARQEFSTGQMVNLVSNDTGRIEMSFMFLHYLWSGPFQILVILGLLWWLVGASVLVGLLMFAVFIPVQSRSTAWLSRFRKETSQISDRRVRLMQELLAGIRVVKFYAWESSFLAQLFALRADELKRVRYSQYVRSALNGVTVVVPVFSTILTFLAYNRIAGRPLTPAVVFPVLAYFNQLRLPLALLPMVLSMVADAKVGLQRIQRFLQADELVFEPIVDEEAPDGLLVEDAVFQWPIIAATSDAPSVKSEAMTSRDALLSPNGSISAVPYTLGPLGLQISRGALVAVVGPVGSGKSTLLSSLVGELLHIRGRVIFGGTSAYAPQQAWIQSLSVRDNVLFGREYDPKRYAAVIEACALKPDLAALPAGDMTEVGERGVTLSGGQKQRIALARVLYSQAQVVLLDDPLSACDAHVGAHIFRRGLTTWLKNSTRILVTHQLQFVPRCDLVIRMEAGRVASYGTVSELMEKDPVFATMMKQHAPSDSNIYDEDEDIETEVHEEHEEIPVNKAAAIHTVEERQTGAVSWSVYSSYIHWAGGLSFLLAVIIAMLLANGAKLGTDLWLSLWSASPPRLHLSPAVWAGVYVAWGVAQALLAVAMGALFSRGGVRAAAALHQAASSRVLGAPVSFFDTTPLGRIMNRFSRDMDTVDNQLPDSLRSLLTMGGLALSSLFLIGITSWTSIPAILLLSILYVHIQRAYRASSRELKRLDSLARSPLYAQFSEALGGLATIRAFRAQSRFAAAHYAAADAHNRPYFLQQSIQRWLGVRLEGIANCLVLATAVACVWWRVGSSATGLAIGYALSMAGALNWLIRQVAETEANIIAAERLSQYAALPQEEEPEGTNNHLKDVPEEWPSAGAIRFDAVSLRYRPELPLVLKDLTLDIKPGERIGIVGRTGAGKSSLISCLFRLTPLESGAITIDGLDTRMIPLERLRRSIAIIPQDPVLFAGTIRSNLDPANSHSSVPDADLWQALRLAHLSDHVASMPGGLDAPVGEGGEGLSVGQRQLLCLARAILRRARVVVLDEATASIDQATDTLIQQSIRSDFGGHGRSTLLTIAHRLSTVLDYDRIMVLDAGQLAEFDTPARLMADPTSILAALLRETNTH